MFHGCYKLLCHNALAFGIGDGVRVKEKGRSESVRDGVKFGEQNKVRRG
jgi:hypothetical protein